jgi:hypothetical protein
MTDIKKIINETVSSPEEASRMLRKLAQAVQELISVDTVIKRQLARVVKAASGDVVFEIRTAPGSSSGGKAFSSPTPKETPRLKVENMEQLRKASAVGRQLYETRADLIATKSRLRTQLDGFPKEQIDRCIRAIDEMLKSVNAKMTDHFAFLSGLAKSHLPEAVGKFTEAVHSILETGVDYESAEADSYLFEEDGDICIAHYIQLRGMVDEEGTSFPRMFVVVTYRSGTSESSGYYLSVLTEFSPPTSDLFVKRVSTAKEVAAGLNQLLELDKFQNSIGSLPVKLMLSSEQVKPAAFGEDLKKVLRAIKLEDKEVIFVTTFRDKTKANQVATKLFPLFRTMIKNKEKVKLRMRVLAVPEGEKYEGAMAVHFYLRMPTGIPVEESDLEFLKLRFNLSDEALKRIVREINRG